MPPDEQKHFNKIKLEKKTALRLKKNKKDSGLNNKI
jgi:hypothetical protein